MMSKLPYPSRDSGSSPSGWLLCVVAQNVAMMYTAIGTSLVGKSSAMREITADDLLSDLKAQLRHTIG